MSGLFTNYVDDSGTDPNQRVAIASGLIIPSGRIVALEREWDTLKTKEGFTDFHTSEFSAWFRNPHSEFSNWGTKQHTRVFARVRGIAKKYGVKTFTFAVKKEDYNDVVPADIKKYWGRYHYTWAIRQFIDYVYKWQRHLSAAPLQYVFDWAKRSDPARKEIEMAMEQAEDMTGNTGEFKHYDFGCRRETPGLQCADVLAWTSYQSALREFYNKPLVCDAEIALNDFTKYNGGKWRTALTVTRSSLEELVRKEQVSGTSLAKFKAWEARKLAEKEGEHGKRRVR